jgi:tubulin polyglutamylase TTLL5
MLQFIDDTKLVDMGVPSFSHLFSGFYNNGSNYSHLDAMKEMLGVFQSHVDRVDKVDQMVKIRASGISHINPQEIIYINDPRKVVTFSSKTGIDI